jgi:hypothetical protein
LTAKGRREEEEEASLQGGKGQGWVLTAPPRTPKETGRTQRSSRKATPETKAKTEKAGEDTQQTRKRKEPLKHTKTGKN